MASSTNYIATVNAGGQTKNFYIRHVTAAAIGVYCLQSKVNVPADTDPVDLVPSGNATIVSFQSPASSTGTIQLIEDGNPLPVYIDVAQHVPTATTRPPLSIPLKKGAQYRWKVVATMWAGA